MVDSRQAASGATRPKAKEAPDWFDQEPRPSATIAKVGRRLFQRGTASWRLWVAVALVGSGGYALYKASTPPAFEVTAVLRVSEGQVSQQGVNLGRGKLRGYVNDLSFTAPNLLKVMSAHPKAFKRAATDPVFAVQSFRENMTVEISENDFVEERGSDDPPRSARMVISYKGPDPELTWQVTQELAELVIGATMGGQRAALEAELQVATAEVTRTAAVVNELEHQQQVAGPNQPLAQARQRLLTAQQRADDASIALRALGQQHVLRFEIVDKGRVPPRPDPVQVGLRTFVVTALLALLAGWMLAGAFDPRVLDETDVTDLWLPVLGRLPVLPELPGGREEKPEPRADTGGVPNPRV